MPAYLLSIEYNGTRFTGWQKQPGCRTVQGEIENAAAKVLGCAVKITAAGRTDKGVHALSQAASFPAEKTLDIGQLRRALNGVLPGDISIVSVKRVPEAFNARFAAKKKVYHYHLWNREYRSVWRDGCSWHVRDRLDLDAMRKAARCILGTRDFSAFDAMGGTQKNKTVTMEEIGIRRKGGMVIFTFMANRYLYKMVRNIVGTLVEVGRGRMTPARVRKILLIGQRRMAGPTAPARGLFLKKVVF